MILPATAARYWAGTITGQLALGFVFALLSCWIGLTLSYLLPETPSGPAIVLVAGGVFLLSVLLGPLGFGGRLRGPSKAKAKTETKTSAVAYTHPHGRTP